MSRFTLVPLTPAQYLRRIDELIELHLAAMHYAPGLHESRKRLWLSSLNNSHFRCHAIFRHPDHTPANPNNPSHDLAGVCFSFTGSPTSWWYQQVYRGLLSTEVPAGTAVDMLSDYAELSEIHIHPSYQGQGLGTQLLDAHTATISNQKILLSTPEVQDEDSAAWALYRKAGFEDLLRNFYFPSDSRPFAILSKQLR